MSEERDINLGQVIKDSDFQDKKEQIAQKLKDNPYSQPLHRLASKLNMDNKLPIHQYAWLEKETEVNQDSKVMNLSSVNLKDKNGKSPTPMKVAASSTAPSNIQPVTDKSKRAPSTQKKQSPSSMQITSETTTQGSSSFTLWLNKKAKPLSSTSDLSDLTTKDTSSPESYEMTPPPANKSKKSKKTLDTAKVTSKKLDKPKAKKSIKEPSKKKKKKTKLQKKIDASLLDHKNIASEPLAKLYKKQGFYKKSLKMYEQLSLINPEKSSFFAPLIEELKNKLK